jgi:hypothetical protein
MPDVAVAFKKTLDIGSTNIFQFDATNGRPKFGIVSREVTLLTTQWDWLATQPGGASVTLRKLVDEARRWPKDIREHVLHMAYAAADATE